MPIFRSFFVGCLFFIGLQAIKGQHNSSIFVNQKNSTSDYYLSFEASPPTTSLGTCCCFKIITISVPMLELGVETFGFSYLKEFKKVTASLPLYPGARYDVGGSFFTAASGGCLKHGYNTKSLSTAAIKPPQNVTATFQSVSGEVKVLWKKQTDIPTNKHRYLITKYEKINVKWVQVSTFTIPGSQAYEYHDKNVVAGKTYHYAIQTYFPEQEIVISSDYTAVAQSIPQKKTFLKGPFTSTAVGVEVSIPPILSNFLVVKEVTGINFTWQIATVSLHNELKLEKKNGTTWTPVATLSENTLSYQSAAQFVAGRTYEFRLRAMQNGTQVQVISQALFIPPDGFLSGHVKLTGTNWGVGGIDLVVTCLALNFSQTITSDSRGYFFIEKLYYSDNATFTITPQTQDPITPSSLTRTLSSVNNNYNDCLFENAVAFNVFGKVTTEAGCPILNAGIMYANQSTLSVTDSSGLFRMTLRDISSPDVISIDYKEHNFGAPVLLDISHRDNELNPILFTDQTKDTMILSVKSECNMPIADNATIALTAYNKLGIVCHSDTSYLGSDGVDTMIVPAYSAYKVQVLDLVTNQSSPAFDAAKQSMINAMPVKWIDLTEKDTVVVSTLVNVDGNMVEQKSISIRARQVPFTAWQTVSIDIINSLWDENAFDSHQVSDGTNTYTENVYKMSQNENYFLQIKAVIHYDLYLPMAHECLCKEGEIIFFDSISNTKVKTNLSEDPVDYYITAGYPNVIGDWNKPHAYQKRFQVKGVFENYEDVTIERWAIIEGNRPIKPVSITDPIAFPLYVLPDPPGNESFAYIEKDEKIVFSTLLQQVRKVADSSGIAFKKGSSESTGRGLMAVTDSFVILEDKDESRHKELIFPQEILTDFGTVNIGEKMDIIIGASMRLVVFDAKYLSFQRNSSPIVRDALSMVPYLDTFYITTVDEARTKGLPRYQTLKSRIDDGTAPDSIKAMEKIYSVNQQQWLTFLSEKHEERLQDGNPVILPSGKQTTTFDFHSPFWYESKSGTNSGNNEYKQTYDLQSIIFEKGLSDVVEVDISGEYQYNNNDSIDGEAIPRAVYTGFVLSDNNEGDEFTVKVSQSNSSGTFLVNTLSGKSSSPYEPNTQNRDFVSIDIVGNSTISGIPDGESTEFKVKISNFGATKENRLYSVIMSPEAVAAGVKVHLGDIKVVGSKESEMIYLENGKNYLYTITIDPLVNTSSFDLSLLILPVDMLELWPAEDIQAFFSLSDWEVDQNSSIDRVLLRAEWASLCPLVEVLQPEDNWYVNTLKNKNLTVEFQTIYNKEQTIDSIDIEYKNKNVQFYSTIKHIAKDNDGNLDLSAIDIDVSNFPYGECQLRVKSYCSETDELRYSKALSGVIDNATFYFIKSNVEQKWLKNEKLILEFSEEVGSITPILQKKDENEKVIDQIEVKATIQKTHVTIEIPEYFAEDNAFYNLLLKPNNVTSVTNKNLTTSQLISFRLDNASAGWKSPVLYVFVIKGAENQQLKYTALLHNKSAEKVSFSLQENRFSRFLVPNIKNGIIPAQSEIPIVFTLRNMEEIPIGIFEGDISGIFTSYSDGIFNKKLKIEIKSVDLAPDWQPPLLSSYNMSVTTAFILPEKSNVLSTDERDIIYAFIGDSCIGRSYLEYDVLSDRYLANMVLKKDNNDSLQVTFKIWDASANRIYLAKEQLTFRDGTSVGSIYSPYTLHVKHMIQRQVLYKGWNFISFNFHLLDPSTPSVFSSIAQEGIIVKSINMGFATFNSITNSWDGNLDFIDIYRGYKVFMPEEAILEVNGHDFNFYGETITENTYDHSWLAVHHALPEKIEDAILVNDITLKEVLINNANNLYAIYDNISETWYGDMKYIIPGQGYQVHKTLKDAANEQQIRLRVKATLSANNPVDTVQLAFYLGGNNTKYGRLLVDQLAASMISVTKQMQVFDIIYPANLLLPLFNEGITCQWQNNYVTHFTQYDNQPLPMTMEWHLFIENKNTNDNQYIDLSSFLHQDKYSVKTNFEEVEKATFPITTTADQCTFTPLSSSEMKQHSITISGEDIILMALNDYTPMATPIEESIVEVPVLNRINHAYTATLIAQTTFHYKPIDRKTQIFQVWQDSILLSESFVNEDGTLNDYLLISGDASILGKELSFTLYDIDKGISYPSAIHKTFENNATWGTAENPLVFSFPAVELNDNKLEKAKAFSPNGDGLNDRLHITELAGLADVQIRILNQGGRLLYISNQYQNDWDGVSNIGKDKGKRVPTGGYIGILQLPNGITKRFQIIVIY